MGLMAPIELTSRTLSWQTWFGGLPGRSKGCDQATKGVSHQNDEPGCCRKAISSGVDSRPSISLRCG